MRRLGGRRPKAGIYRLVGLDDAGKLATLDRICGSDQTGTLYIGCEGKNFAIRSRLSKLVRSLREPRSRGGGYINNEEHNAGCACGSIESLSPRRLVGNCDINLGYVGYERHRHCDVEFDEAVFRGVAVGGQRNRATLSGGCLYLLGRFSIPM